MTTSLPGLTLMLCAALALPVSGKTALDQGGKLWDPATHAAMSPTRPDTVGSIFALDEADSARPGASRTFKYFRVWLGSNAGGLWDAANPDNLMIDRDGGVWFGTDGNFGTSGKKSADALYYLDLNPAHKAGQMGVVKATWGLPFRFAAMPSDAENTGPAFSSDMGTIFTSVQHPGEDNYSAWP